MYRQPSTFYPSDASAINPTCPVHGGHSYRYGRHGGLDALPAINPTCPIHGRYGGLDMPVINPTCPVHGLRYGRNGGSEPETAGGWLDLPCVTQSGAIQQYEKYLTGYQSGKGSGTCWNKLPQSVKEFHGSLPKLLNEAMATHKDSAKVQTKAAKYSGKVCSRLNPLSCGSIGNGIECRKMPGGDSLCVPKSMSDAEFLRQKANVNPNAPAADASVTQADSLTPTASTTGGRAKRAAKPKRKTGGAVKSTKRTAAKPKRVAGRKPASRK